METIFGAGNGIGNYLLVLLVYGLMFLLIRSAKPVLELNYKGIFLLLLIFWFLLMFVGNYAGYKLGVMAFLPWLNNFLHTFVWVGLCLNWLYYVTKERPLWEQILFFAWTSFIVKVAEHLLLGTWHRPSYLGINNPYAYIIAMSGVDGFYPIITLMLLRLSGKVSKPGETVSS